MSKPSIPQFFAGKNVFVTGGSGFVGVCLIEKLLRGCPNIGTVYLLLRPKRGKEIGERLGELKKNKVFDKLLEIRPEDEVFSKLVAVAGDVGQDKLGLSDGDKAILKQNVNVVIHSAATLDFEATLKPTVEINLLGTRRVMELCSELPKLLSVVHVSSAYVNSWQLKAEEIIYPLKEDPKKVIDLTTTLNEAALEEITPKLLGDHPNTYTFTKHMAEHVVQEYQERFPCAIVRPSMITASWEEPVPGWTISKNGPQGFLMGASKGVIRRLPVGTELVYDYIPVDTVVNCLIAAAYYTALEKPKKVQVYHCTSSTRKPFRWSSVENEINNYLHRYPLKSAVWYPHLKFVSSITRFRIAALFVHILPAILLDTLTRLMGGRPILMKLHRNVNSSLSRLERFIFTEWEFPAVSTDKLQKYLLPDDQQNFNLDISTLDWNSYFINLTIGVRKYLNKEDMRNIESARSKDTLLMVFHLLVQGLWYFMIWYLVATLLGTTLGKIPFVVPIAYLLFGLL